MLTFLCDSLYNSKASCASDSQVYGILAQLGEHLPYKQRVIGSSPIGPIMDGFPSGQRGQTVNLLQIASVVRIHLHPFGFVPVMSNHDAGVAELADAQDLKSCEG